MNNCYNIHLKITNFINKKAMNSNSYFPVVVDLSSFFYDHRRIARIFINNAIKSVLDLQNRLSSIFSIKDFYLTTGGHFLPELEDIGILQKNETVCAIPKGPSPNNLTAKTTLNDESKLKKHRHLNVITEEEPETASPKKKKTKKKQKSHTNEQPLIETDDNESKAKRSKRNIEELALEEIPKKKRKHKEKQINVQEEICNIECAQTINDIKKKLKEKTEEHIKKFSKNTDQLNNHNIKSLLPKLQNHIKSYNDSGRGDLPDTVRLSRHNDTPIKTYTKYVPPTRITDQYLAKNKVNIVSIDIIKKGNDLPDDIDKINENINPSTTIPKNSVREIINSFEESFSNDASGANAEGNSGEIEHDLVESKEQINGKSQNEENHNISMVEPNISLSSTPFKNETKQDFTTNANGVELDLMNNDMSVDISAIKECTPSREDCSSPMSSSSFGSTSNSIKSVSIKSVNSHKSHSGVGILLENLKNDSGFPHDKSSENVTKRKRVRTRKRKKKEKNNDVSELPLYTPRSLDLTALPNVHIKFDDEAGKGSNEGTTNTNKSNISMGALVLSDDDDEMKIVMENKQIYSETSILTSQIMENLQPKVGDVIAFKILKMGENYNPQLSAFIIGKVVRFSLESNSIGFKILNGEKELMLPKGKLTMKEDGGRDSHTIRYKDFCWSELMEKRLLNN